MNKRLLFFAIQVMKNLNRFFQRTTLISLVFLLGCSPMKVNRQDPLIGKIYSSRNQQQINYQELLGNIEKKDIIYLGENHDNPDHHRYQIQIINDLLKKGKRPSIGFEFFSVDQTGHLMSFVSRGKIKHPPSADIKREEQLRRDLGWLDRSDRTWQFYFQFIQLALENNLTVFGADLPSGIVRRITRVGPQNLTPVEQEFLKPTKLQDESYRKLMYEKFKASHCGFAHKRMMEKMYETWLARNDTMAHSIAEMFQTNPQQPIVMILGKGHVEHNMAVYDRVNYRLPEVSQLNLGFIEISIQPSSLEDYFPISKIDQTSFAPYHEFLWFTQRTSYEDPCQRFREQLKLMKKVSHQPTKKKKSSP